MFAPFVVSALVAVGPTLPPNDPQLGEMLLTNDDVPSDWEMLYTGFEPEEEPGYLGRIERCANEDAEEDLPDSAFLKEAQTLCSNATTIWSSAKC